MPVAHARCGGLAVPRRTKACGPLTHPAGTTTARVRTFSTRTDRLLALADWLQGLAVSRSAMESTGVYRRPLYTILEADCAVLLVNARHIKAVPGREPVTEGIGDRPYQVGDGGDQRPRRERSADADGLARWRAGRGGARGVGAGTAARDVAALAPCARRANPARSLDPDRADSRATSTFLRHRPSPCRRRSIAASSLSPERWRC